MNIISVLNYLYVRSLKQLFVINTLKCKKLRNITGHCEVEGRNRGMVHVLHEGQSSLSALFLVVGVNCFFNLHDLN